MPSRLLMLFAETPIHAGGGESLGVVDLPIQREAASGLPVIWGQSLKGALRETARKHGWTLDRERAVFGSRPPGFDGADGDADDGAGDGKLTRGGVSVGDAQLLLFPAATLINTFAWVTAPLALARLTRKTALVGADPASAVELPQPGSRVLAGSSWSGKQVIGPYLRQVDQHQDMLRLGAILAALACPSGPVFAYTRTKFGSDVLVVDDEVFTGLAQTGTDVVARVQLETEKKTVKYGPFYSEHLPAETVLAAVLTGTEAHLDHLTELLDHKILQLGGDETIGKGLLWCRLHDTASVAAALTTTPPSQPATARADPAVPSPTSTPATRQPDTPRSGPGPAGAPPKPGHHRRGGGA